MGCVVSAFMGQSRLSYPPPLSSACGFGVCAGRRRGTWERRGSIRLPGHAAKEHSARKGGIQKVCCLLWRVLASGLVANNIGPDRYEAHLSFGVHRIIPQQEGRGGNHQINVLEGRRLRVVG